MSKKIVEMFDKISPKYDRINRIVSLGRDQHWRQTVARFLPAGKELKILDLATGTGDQALSLLQSGASIHSVTGIDLSTEMLEIAKRKIPQVKFLHANAEELPFEENSFNAATFSFGIRNVTDPLRSLKEIHRVLKPNGRALILEFSLPKYPIRPFFLFYLRYILPPLAGLLSQNFSAYRYLNKTIEHFPSGENFCRLLKEANFTRIQQIPMNLGSVTLYVGEKE